MDFKTNSKIMDIIEFVTRLKSDGFYISKDNHIVNPKGKSISKLMSNGYYLTSKH